MTDSTRRFRILLESGAEPGLEHVAVPPSAPPGAIAEALDALFAAEPGLDRVNLVVGDRVLGTTSSEVLNRLRDRTHRTVTQHDPGAGDGATLPGYSTDYVILQFQCPSCDARVRLLFADDTPTCPNGHGPLERLP